MNLTRRLSALVLAGGLLAVTPTAAPADGPDRGATPDVQVVRDVAYAPAEPAGSRGHLLDLYLPADGHRSGRDRTRPRPLVVWTGGSGWLADNGKDSAGPIAEVFNPRGYVVAGVSVRSSGQARFPAQVHDIKAAIRWLRAHARDYRIDPSRIAVMGNSSGGWVASMAGLTGASDRLEGTVGERRGSSRVQAVVDFFGPTRFTDMNDQMLPGACEAFNAAFGLQDCHDDPRSPESLLLGCPVQECDPGLVAAADPATYAGRGDPPVLLAHGQADVLVPEGQSAHLYDALRAARQDARFYSVPAAGHSVEEVTAATTAGVTARTTRHGRERVTVGVEQPTWDAIAAWVDDALRVRRHPHRGR